MTRVATSAERTQSLGEEIANSVSHGVGLVAAVAATPVLIINAAHRGGPADVVGAGIFVTTVILLYSASMLYHAFPPSRAKRVFRILDHSAIFFLIAGTYTPFLLGALYGAWGWSLLGIIWSLALLGVVLKTVSGVRYAKLSLGLYLAMGWIIVIAAKPLSLAMPVEGLLWLLSGGIAYTAGVALYAAKRLPYGHFVWHLFVLAGTTCHFVAVWRFAA
jgi:hemolysin III